MAREPIWASERTAAELLDMTPAEFRRLVEGGYLPAPREIAPGMIRWDAAHLRAIGNGNAVDGGIDW